MKHSSISRSLKDYKSDQYFKALPKEKVKELTKSIVKEPVYINEMRLKKALDRVYNRIENDWVIISASSFKSVMWQQFKAEVNRDRNTVEERVLHSYFLENYRQYQQPYFKGVWKYLKENERKLSSAFGMFLLLLVAFLGIALIPFHIFFQFLPKVYFEFYFADDFEFMWLLLASGSVFSAFLISFSRPVKDRFVSGTAKRAFDLSSGS